MWLLLESMRLRRCIISHIIYRYLQSLNLYIYIYIYISSDKSKKTVTDICNMIVSSNVKRFASSFDDFQLRHHLKLHVYSTSWSCKSIFVIFHGCRICIISIWKDPWRYHSITNPDEKSSTWILDISVSFTLISIQMKLSSSIDFNTAQCIVDCDV